MHDEIENVLYLRYSDKCRVIIFIIDMKGGPYSNSLEDATYQAKHLQKMYADLDKPSKPSDVHKEEEES